MTSSLRARAEAAAVEILSRPPWMGTCGPFEPNIARSTIRDGILAFVSSEVERALVAKSEAWALILEIEAGLTQDDAVRTTLLKYAATFRILAIMKPESSDTNEPREGGGAVST